MPKTNNQIPVFQIEKKDGLDGLIRSTNSIAYVTKLESIDESRRALRQFFKSVSAQSDLDDHQFDLFYLNTILVTTGWNKNYDVFDKIPTWQARYTPVHKPFNIEHDQSKIIGHMTSARAVDTDYNIIPDDITVEDLPDKFHILTGAVIYRVLSDDDARAYIDKTIGEIQDGLWYVSMECLFRGFDYAITASTGEQGIIPRTEETAFLTKHLKQYGGKGVYTSKKGKEFTIGRLLKNFTFSGKGLVRQPANPESVIFNDHVSTFKSLGYLTASAGLDINVEKIMANDPTNTEVVQLKELKEENKSLREQISKFESSATTAKLQSLETEVKTKTDRIGQLEVEVNTITTRASELQEKVKGAEDRAQKAELELASIKEAEKTRLRVAKLTSMKAPEQEAKEIVSIFADKNDGEFDKIVALFSDKWKVQPDTPPPVLKNAEPVGDTTPLAANTSHNDQVESTRAKMSEAFTKLLFSPFDDNEVK